MVRLSEVDEFNFQVGTYHNVVGLQVQVHDTVTLQEAQGFNNAHYKGELSLEGHVARMEAHVVLQVFRGNIVHH